MTEDHHPTEDSRGTSSAPAESPREPGARIGVCGVQAAGKTVFLTCVFQTIETVIPEHGFLSLDRKGVGGANYYEGVEKTIRRTGSTEGTREEAEARLFLKIDDPKSSLRGHLLPIELFDFAGKYFESFADLKAVSKAVAKADLPADEQEPFLRVDRHLESCDGLIILISAKLFNHHGKAAGENPFPKSVTTLIDDCWQKKRPVALVISQADSNPHFDEQELLRSPRIQRFQHRFVSDRQEAQAEDRPFGMVKLLSCYELDSGDLPKQQSADGSIWKTDATEVFLEVLKAAWPRIRTRLEREERRRERTERRQQEALARAARRKRKRRWLRGAVILLALSALGALGWFLVTNYQQSQENKDAARVTQVASTIEAGQFANLTPEQREAVGRIRREHEVSAKPSRVVGEALDELWETVGQATIASRRNPSLDSGHARALEMLQAFAPVLPEGEVRARLGDAAPAMEARRGFIAAWDNLGESDHQTRLDTLRTAIQQFQDLDDQAFAELLTAEATREKHALVEEWDASFAVASTVTMRLQQVRTHLLNDAYPEDPEYRLIARRYLAQRVVSAMMELEDNPAVQAFLEAVVPKVKDFQGRNIPFNLVYRELQNIDNLAELSARKNTMQPLSDAAFEAVQERRLLTESTLHDLMAELTAEQHLEVWRAVIETLNDYYIIHLDAATRVSGITPRPLIFEEILATGEPQWKKSRQLISELVERPIYYRELRGIETLINKHVFRYRAIHQYRRIVGQLESASSYYLGSTTLDTAYIQALIDEVAKILPEDVDFLEETRTYVESQERQLNSVVLNMERFNQDPGTYWKDYVVSQLERLIESHCEGLRATTGDCADET